MAVKVQKPTWYKSTNKATAKKATSGGISFTATRTNKSTGKKTTTTGRTTPITKGKFVSGAVGKNKGFTAPSTTEKRESYGASRYQTAVKKTTAAKNAVINRTPNASTFSGAIRPKATATKGTALKAGTITNNAPKTGFSMGETTEARTSYGSARPKSSATSAKKLY